jgi:hypothetical protein
MPDPAILELTPEEANRGFIQAVVANGEEWAMHSRLSRAVILPIRPGVRIIKMKWINDSIAYQLRVFGEHALAPSFGRLPSKWQPASNPLPAPHIAVAAAQGRLDPVLAGAVEINEAGMSSLVLACPKCGENFEVHEDHVPLDYVATCPNCNEKSPISKCQSTF